MNTVWSCKIGMKGGATLPPGSDAPMRSAVRRAFAEVTGVDDDFAFTGWGASLTHSEQYVVDDDWSTLPPTNEGLAEQIERLANFIMAELPGEPSQSEGAVDTAIRWMRERTTGSRRLPSWNRSGRSTSIHVRR